MVMWSAWEKMLFSVWLGSFPVGKKVMVHSRNNSSLFEADDVSSSNLVVVNRVGNKKVFRKKRLPPAVQHGGKYEG